MIKRKYYSDKIANAFDYVPIVVLIGARQVGKTSLMDDYASNSTSVQNSLKLNGQNAEIAELFQKFSTIEQYLQVYMNEDLRGLLLIDEFQYIEGISVILKLLTDKYSELKILCSGSSSLNILQNVEESLAGRVRVIEVLSLSFAEYLLFNNGKTSELYEKLNENTESSVLTAPIEQIYSEYLIYGGFPRAALAKNREEKAEILNDIYQTYLLKDVRSFIKNEQTVGFNKILRMLASQIANLLNVNELSRESGVPYKQCEEFLYLLEQMYIIKLIEPYQVNKRKVITKMKKVFFCDLGLRNIIERNFNEINFRADNGAIFENAVMLELWRRKGAGGELQFYRTADGTEVDFVLSALTRKTAVECKLKAMTKPVKLIGFENFCNEENIENRFVVNSTLNTLHNGTHFIQGFLTDKITL
ncbi:MAG: ATP-binding protein [Culturomica sp.]|jgi:predicted AAA+ superfamily ATPase|nr:ATP-binding protein [Culturomica sp.]